MVAGSSVLLITFRPSSLLCDEGLFVSAEAASKRLSKDDVAVECFSGGGVC